MIIVKNLEDLYISTIFDMRLLIFVDSRQYYFKQKFETNSLLTDKEIQI